MLSSVNGFLAIHFKPARRRFSGLQQSNICREGIRIVLKYGGHFIRLWFFFLTSLYSEFGWSHYCDPNFSIWQGGHYLISENVGRSRDVPLRANVKASARSISRSDKHNRATKTLRPLLQIEGVVMGCKDVVEKSLWFWRRHLSQCWRHKERESQGNES